MTDKIQEVLDNAPEVSLGDCYRAFFDLSSTCTGYVVAKFQGRTCTITRAGVYWFGDVPNGEKFFKIQQFITNHLYVENAITDIIYESYNVNPKMVANSLVVPEMIGAIKACVYDIASEPLGIEMIPPTGWRAKLGVKADKNELTDKFGNAKLDKKGRPQVKRDWKEPVKRYMDNLFEGQIPQKIRSNVTGNFRSTPSDLYDAFGICVGWHKKWGCDEFIIADNCFDGVDYDL